MGAETMGEAIASIIGLVVLSVLWVTIAVVENIVGVLFFLMVLSALWVTVGHVLLGFFELPSESRSRDDG